MLTLTNLICIMLLENTLDIIRFIKNEFGRLCKRGMESQAHGFTWENHIKKNVYEIQSIADYTRKNDVDPDENKIDGCAVSIKTSGGMSVDMGDARRIFEATDGDPYHMVVVQYDQIDDNKVLTHVMEVDLTDARKILFGDLTYQEISDFHEELKRIPPGRVQKEDKLYLSRSAELNRKSKEIILRPKVDSKKQRRLQCSFTNIDYFCHNYPSRLLYKSSEGIFKGVQLPTRIESGRRIRHPKTNE